MSTPTINRGTGAGGSKTNANGLPYEVLTDLETEYTIVKTEVSGESTKIKITPSAEKYATDNKIDIENISGTGAGGKILVGDVKKYKDARGTPVKFKDSDTVFVRTQKTGLFKTLPPAENVDKAHGCKEPDECYINFSAKTLFILEKKFQECSGSVCEKIQTAPAKIDNYSDLFPEYKIVYFYCLCDWFKDNCKAELKYLKKTGVPVFWGSSPDYKKNVVEFITQY
jgi:hypothetical protein